MVFISHTFSPDLHQPGCYTTLFEKMPEGVVYQDSKGKIIESNHGAETLLGLSSDQLQGKTSIDPEWHAIHPDGTDFPGDTHPAMISLKTGKTIQNEIMGVFNPQRKKYTWISINSVPEFKPGEKEPFQVFTTFLDITHQVEAEQKLKSQSELLELLVHTSSYFCFENFITNSTDLKTG